METNLYINEFIQKNAQRYQGGTRWIIDLEVSEDTKMQNKPPRADPHARFTV